MPKSEERVGPFGGTYTEHVDDDGNRVGESHQREGLFGGSYVEHRSNDGRVTGESHDREGILGGKYRQHYDHEGSEAGESHERQGVFGGRYTQHYDKDHREAGQSVERQGILGGKYIEHTTSGGASVAVADAGSAGRDFELSDLFAGGVLGHLFRLLCLGICYGSGYVFTTVADPFSGLWWAAVVAFFVTVIPALTFLLSAIVVLLGIAAVVFVAQFVLNLVF